MENERKFHPGDYVIHFKRGMMTAAQLSREPNMYRYVVFGVAEHSDTGEKLMIFRQLFGLCKLRAMPMDEFMAEVDTAEYPEAKQKHIFERYIPTPQEETPL